MRKRLLYGLICIAACVLGFLGILYAQVGPSFEIQAPFAGQVIEGPKLPITVNFRNSDNVPVVRYDIYIDGKQFFGGPFRNLLSAGSFVLNDQCDIARTKAEPGNHAITIRLTDAQGRIAERSVTVDYEPINTRPIEHNPPQVHIVKPIDGATISDKTDVCIEASDDSGLKIVRVYIDGQQRAFTNNESFAFVWDPVAEKVVSGSHTLTASAWDIFDNQGNSTPVMVLVSNQYLPENGNLTPIERALSTPLMTPVTLIPVLSPTPAQGGQQVSRLPITGIVVPNWTAGLRGLSVPNMFSDITRTNAMPTVEAGALAVIPVKAQPGTGSLSTLPLASVVGQGNITGSALLGPKPVALIVPREELGDNAVIAMVPIDNSTLPRMGEVAGARTPIQVTPAQQSLAVGKQAPANSAVISQVPGSNGQETSLQATSLQPQAKSGKSRVDAPGVAVIGPDGQFVPTTATVLTGRQEVANTPTVVAAVPSMGKGAPTTTTPVASLETIIPAVVIPVPASTEQPLPRSAQVKPHVDAPKVDIATNGGTVLPSLNAVKPGRTETAAAPVVKVGGTTGKSAPATTVLKANPIVTPVVTPAPKAQQVPAQSSVIVNPLTKLSGKYTVQNGDTLSKIAQRYSTSSDEIVKLNPSINPAQLVPGDRLNVPRRGTHISLDDKTLAAKPSPYIAGAGYTMVPMRTLVQAKGGVIVWLPKTREVNAWVSNNYMGVTIGKRQARINSEVYILPVAALIRDSRTIVPLRFVARGMNLTLVYDPASKASALTSKTDK
ncbi:MAG TPA: Ig-like domain-containing protein [Armatimonadota bacterium]|nr:Ig-like domain-containing protein [Armatimonadota bacterium]